ncbi:MAG: serine/threonine-protein phosphatase [Phycisphaerae bacterium]|nr:serine/threonine-protein phosphatase [Phycisphaerae bacterium]
MEVWGGSARFSGRLSMPGNEVHLASEPHRGADEGGDVYYLSNCAAGLITRGILADISGHGASAAPLARALRDLMRRHINTADQSRLAADLNRAFSRDVPDGRFATAVLATYFAPTDHLIVCNAGHPHPLLRRSDGAWLALSAGTPGVVSAAGSAGAVGIANLPLGVLDPIGYEQFAVRLEPGDRVLLYSDALIEAPGPDGRQVGEAGLLEIARGLSEAELDDPAGALVRRVEALTGRALDDDATVIALRHTAENPPRVSWRARAAALAGMLGLGVTHAGPGVPRAGAMGNGAAGRGISGA